MGKDGRDEETVDLRNSAESVRSVSDKHSGHCSKKKKKHSGLLRPFARTYSRGHEKGKYTLVKDPEDLAGIYDKPLPCFGCGIGWFSFLFGFLCPPMWYYATILYFGNYYRKDPRERAGLGASAIAALVCSAVLLIIAAILLLKSSHLYF